MLTDTTGHVSAGALRYSLDHGSVAVGRSLPIPLAAAPDVSVITMRGRQVRHRRFSAAGAERADAPYWAIAFEAGKSGISGLYLLAGVALLFAILAAFSDVRILAIPFVVGALVLAFFAYMKQRTILLYDIDQEAQRSYGDLTRTLGWLRSARRVQRFWIESWTSGEEELRNFKQAPFMGGTDLPRGITSNITPPLAVFGDTKLYFFPDVILVEHHRSFSYLRYSDLEISTGKRRVVELGDPPSDAKVVGKTWEHVTRKGQPDLRYKDNWQYDVVEYSEVIVKSPPAWSLSLLISRTEAATNFANGLAQYSGKSATDIQAVRQQASKPKASPKPAQPRHSPQSTVTRDEPVTIASGNSGSVSYRITFRDSSGEESNVNADELWVPKGRPVTISDFEIKDGMVYVGNGLLGRWREAEPSLINPSLEIRSRNMPGRATDMGYWPAYNKIDPAHRKEYLEWHEGGRKDPSIQIGYVFIFFYGLERRALIDTRKSARAKNDLPGIASEVQRLLSIYGENGSFRAYASGFLSTLDLLQSDGERFYRRPAPEITEHTWEQPAVVTVALGQAAMDDAPLPADWALQWLRSNPEHRLRTPAYRCPDEFNKLFTMRYSETFGEGLKLKPGKSTVDLNYRAASAAITHAPLPIEVRNVLGADATLKKLVKIAEGCTNDLDAFSRWLGKNPDGRSSIAALAHLPNELRAHEGHDEAEALENLLSGRFQGADRPMILLDELLFFFSSNDPQKLRKNEAVMLAQALEHLGYGIEPDVRFGGRSIGAGDKVVLFRQSRTAPTAPSAEYSSATALLHLAAMVATADDHVSTEELDSMSAHVSESLHLDDDERARLRAHLDWLLVTKPGTAGLKKRLKELKPQQRQSIADFVVTIAAADGHIDPTEVDVLTKIYSLLGLDKASLFSVLHAAAIDTQSETGAPAEQPRVATTRTPGKQPSTGVDMSLVEQKMADTAAVSALLGNIFREEDPAPVPSAEPVTDGQLIDGLDHHHTRLFVQLTTRSSWSRDEIELIASELDLMVDGALEAINDIAFDRIGEPIWEGEDPIELNLEIAGELMQ